MKKCFSFILVIIMASTLTSVLFGCENNAEAEHKNFDTKKAYCYHRHGMIAGGECRVEVEPEGVVKWHEYSDEPREGEDGMSDHGADLYFVGLKEGSVEVTVIYDYPNTEDQTENFSLDVDKDLRVTLSEK